jgi:hypothetical protein
MESSEFVRNYVLLRYKDVTMPTPNLFVLSDSIMDELEKHQGPVAFDYETSGLKWKDEGFLIRSVSFHNDDISLAIEVYNPYVKPETRDRLMRYIANHRGLIAHNAMFEAGVTFAVTGKIPAILCCTRALGMQLAGEGSPGQSWGLKVLAKDLLGWGDWSKGVDVKNAMDIPWDVLGKYNQIDSAATWELFKIMRDVVTAHKSTWGKFFWEYHQQDFMNLVDLQIEAYSNGLNIDETRTITYQGIVQQEIEDKRKDWYSHEIISQGVKVFNKSVVDELKGQLKKIPVTRKDGQVTKRWENAKSKVQEAETTMHFNIDSNTHLKWMLYDYLKLEAPKKTKKGEPSVDADSLERIPIYGEMILSYRASIAMFKFLRALLSNQKGGIVRIPIKTPGTITGRCSAGEIE